jgi:putative lipoic acid-binding regulatory protein
MDPDNQDVFYERLKEELLRTSSWPSVYLYKFIVPSEPVKIEQIGAIFNNTGAVIESRLSRNGKYTSLSITVDLDSPDEVIAKYRRVGEIEGVISL